MALASAKPGYIPNVAASCYDNCGLVLGRLLLLNVCNIFKGDFGKNDNGASFKAFFKNVVDFFEAFHVQFVSFRSV